MLETATRQLDALLDLICEDLQLSPSLHDDAESRYIAVGEWLGSRGSPLSPWHPTIYPQGSFRIGTTTRPLERDEYDLDLVCELFLDTSLHQPDEILGLVEARLREHGTYAPMVERLKRCVRLNYAGQFHLDILPAGPEVPAHGARIRIPDRKLQAWLSSDPKGYAAWFELRSEQYRAALRRAAEPVPDHQTADEKTPLQRTVQLLKRWRDVAFRKDPEMGPRSIVLTTLAGRAYQGERSTGEAFGAIVSRIGDQVRVSTGPLDVRNPANAEERLSERWFRIPDSYTAFVQKLGELERAWCGFVPGLGLPGVRSFLGRLFDERVTDTALRQQAEQMERSRSRGTLGVGVTGILTTSPGAGRPVLRNTFYGELES